MSEQEINELSGGFTGALDRADTFGESLAALGDLNGDGVPDLAVGAIGDDDGGIERGAVWILFLRPDGTVLGHAKISAAASGLAGTLTDGEQFGARLAALGDLDGDGVSELAVTSQNERRLRVLFLERDGTLRRHTEITALDPAFGGAARPGDFYYGGLAGVGDLDRDGTPDLAWGAPYDSTGAEDAGAVWLVHMNPGGTAKSARRIASGLGGFTGTLAEDDYFGLAIQPLGDVNGDGHTDLGVLDYEPTGTLGRLWILFLGADAQVVDHRVVTGREFRMVWQQEGHLGYVLEVLGDLDRDGVSEIAVHSLGFRGRGGVAIGFLDREGQLRRRVAIGNGVAGLPFDADRSDFGWSLAWLGDLDGDGAPELAVGDRTAEDSGRNVGSLSVLSLDPDAVRNGSGVNPLTLSQRTEPVLGKVWSATLDCSSHAPGIAFLEGYERPLAGTPTFAGELLVDLTSPHVFWMIAPHSGGPVAFSELVPNNLALLHLTVAIQGACSGAPGVRLSNALDTLTGR